MKTLGPIGPRAVGERVNIHEKKQNANKEYRSLQLQTGACSFQTGACSDRQEPAATDRSLQLQTGACSFQTGACSDRQEPAASDRSLQREERACAVRRAAGGEDSPSTSLFVFSSLLTRL